MGLSEETRNLAFQMYRDQLGEEGTAEMLSIYPSGEATIVTSDHLDRRVAELRADMAGLRTEMARLSNQITLRVGVLLGVATGIMALWS
jgi:hypothetical protein